MDRSTQHRFRTTKYAHVPDAAKFQKLGRRRTAGSINIPHTLASRHQHTNAFVLRKKKKKKKRLPYEIGTHGKTASRFNKTHTGSPQKFCSCQQRASEPTQRNTSPSLPGQQYNNYLRAVSTHLYSHLSCFNSYADV